MGGRIEPAGPEPPPAHSLGRVGEDAMGRSGQLVLVFFIRYAINFVPFFFLIFLNVFLSKTGQKSEKGRKKVPKSLKVLFALGVILGPQIHKKYKQSTSKKQAKNDTPKNNFFRRSGAIFVPKKAEIKGFWMDFGCQVWSFSKLFLALKFWMVL